MNLFRTGLTAGRRLAGAREAKNGALRTLDLGTVFDTLTARGANTVVRLSRPLDIDPGGGTVYPMAGLAALVRRVSGWLAAAGIQPGDRVAVVKDNHWDCVLLACAAARLGAVPALISDHLRPDTTATLLHRVEPALLVTTAKVLTAVPEATRLVGRVLDLTGDTPGVLTTDVLAGHREPAPFRRRDDDPLAINHTSGTTGTPKLVVHSTATMIRRLAAFEANRRIPVLTTRTDDTVANAISYVHGRAIPWTVSMLWRSPATLAIMHDADPAVAAPILREVRPSVVETLPAGYVRWQSLVDRPGHGLDRVRLYINTFDAIHPSTVRDLLAASRRRSPVWLQVWGQTETGPLTLRVLTRRVLANRVTRRPTTRHLGWPVPSMTGLRVVDPGTLTTLRRGRVGMVLARTEARCLGYLGEQHRWRDKVHGDWFNTGDIGSRSWTGALRLLDREVDLIPGTSCLEIEDILDDRLTNLCECVLLGSPGRLPVPVVVTTDGTLDPTAWRSAVRDLPPMAEPVLLAWDDVPRTGTGKVRRGELRRRLAGIVDTHGSGRWT